MNKIDLKNRLELLYCKSLKSHEYTYLSAIDAVKSIYGINLEILNSNLIEWLEKYVNIDKNTNESIIEDSDNNKKETISFFNLEESLLKKIIENLLIMFFSYQQFQKVLKYLSFY